MKKPFKRNKLYARVRKSPTLVLVLLLIVMAISGLGSKLVHAVSCSSVSDCQAQINNLNNQNTQAQQYVNSLSSRIQSYQNTINSLGAQIASVQQQLSANQAKQAALQQQITANEQEIANKKAVLADDIKTMYVDGQMTTLEELATSSNLSSFVDKQEYQSVVQSELNAIIQQINGLQKQLQSQKLQVAGLISTEQTQNVQLTSAENQQQQLLSYNQAQQAAYNAQIATDNSNISQLTAQLTALNSAGTTSVVSSGVCGGGYPAQALDPYYPGDGFNKYWGCNYPQDSSEDNWHMENRECVSYTAYMAYTKYGVSTSNWGDAYQWIASAEAAGYTVNQTPAVGAIAIRNRDYNVPGDVGHAMYVVAVNGPDSITVDEYNENYNGTFDQRTFAPSSYANRGGLYYIHFN